MERKADKVRLTAHGIHGIPIPFAPAVERDGNHVVDAGRDVGHRPPAVGVRGGNANHAGDFPVFIRPNENLAAPVRRDAIRFVNPPAQLRVNDRHRREHDGEVLGRVYFQQFPRDDPVETRAGARVDGEHAQRHALEREPPVAVREHTAWLLARIGIGVKVHRRTRNRRDAIGCQHLAGDVALASETQRDGGFAPFARGVERDFIAQHRAVQPFRPGDGLRQHTGGKGTEQRVAIER